MDDDRADRTATKRVLSRAEGPVYIEEASSIDEAIEKIDLHQPELMLLDYQMPDVDGFQGLELIRECHPFLPIVMVTGHGSETLATSASHAGADHYVPKASISLENLENAMATAKAKAQLRKTIHEQQSELKQFARVLSHDLKAPLNRMRNFADIISEDVKAGQLDDLEVMCDQLKHAASDAIDLVKLLTTFLDEPDIAYELIDVKDLLKEIAEVAKSDQQGPCSVVNNSPALTIESCRPLLFQLFQNVISNGLKYNRNDKPTVTITYLESESHHIFEFKDNGIGIEEDLWEEIFKPFVRLHGDSEFRGSGMGLAICHKNAKRLGAAISFTSTLGSGSCFRITLPKAADAGS
ncbi:ATP-binding protein [Litorivivens sp.]|uniref:sensor histidine kinase n=2 Tax=Litorivivens sp. TaxID=2020868 RepID=UPI0035674608